MSALSSERPSRRWTLAALAGGLAALLPHYVAPERAFAAVPKSGPRPQPTSRSQRGRWEYALYDLQTYRATRYNTFFNQLGNDGWELVGMSSFTPVAAKDGEHVLVTFKRAT